MDRIQYDCGEGPSLHAARGEDVVYVADLQEEDRWPQLRRRVQREPSVGSVLSFRLFVDGETLGALNLYARRPEAFDDQAFATGGVFATHAAVALNAARQQERAETLEDALQRSHRQTRRYAQQAELAIAYSTACWPSCPT